MGSSGLADRLGGSGGEGLFEGDSEEREAIQAIDGEAALCVQCGEFLGLEEEHISVAGERVLHQRCYVDWYEAQFGKRPMNDPGAEPAG